MLPPTRTRIKICGISSESDAAAAVEAGADAIGLVFAPNSPRCVDMETAYVIACSLPLFVEPVALFVNAQATTIRRFCERTLIRTIQLHGDEEPALVRDLSADFRIIRAVRYSRESLRRWHEEISVDVLLADGATPGKGQAFDWSELAPWRHELEKPLILAGGLNPDNVAHAIGSIKPYAVDVSSGVETSPGRKDPARIHDFCRAVRDADFARQESN